MEKGSKQFIICLPVVSYVAHSISLAGLSGWAGLCTWTFDQIKAGLYTWNRIMAGLCTWNRIKGLDFVSGHLIKLRLDFVPRIELWLDFVPGIELKGWTLYQDI